MFIGDIFNESTNKNLTELKKGQKDANGYTRCWPGKHAEGTKKGKNGGRVRNCVPNESIVKEFAPPGSGDGDDGFSEETLKRLAAQWYNGDEDPRVERTLAAAGWEIGQDEGYDDEPGVFVVQSGDINGNSYLSWPADELREGVAEGLGYSQDPEQGKWYHRGRKAQQRGDGMVGDDIRDIAKRYGCPPEWVGAFRAGYQDQEGWSKSNVAEGKQFIVAYINEDNVDNIQSTVIVADSAESARSAFRKNNPDIFIESITEGEMGYDTLSADDARKILQKLDKDEPLLSIFSDFPELSRMYDNVAGEMGLHPDDEEDEILGILYDELDDLANSDRYNESLDEDWQKVNRKDKTDGMSSKAVKAYRREHPGSKLKTAVTTKPSKLKKGSKSAKRRKSFCARMKGMKKAHASAKTKRNPDSPINKALRRWNCESVEELQQMLENSQRAYNLLLKEGKVGYNPDRDAEEQWKAAELANQAFRNRERNAGLEDEDYGQYSVYVANTKLGKWELARRQPSPGLDNAINLIKNLHAKFPTMRLGYREPRGGRVVDMGTAKTNENQWHDGSNSWSSDKNQWSNESINTSTKQI